MVARPELWWGAPAETVAEVREGLDAWTTHTYRAEGRLVASVRVRRAPDDPATWQIGRPMVAPDMQGKGIGGRLVMEILTYLPEQTSEVFIMTAHDQRKAIDPSGDSMGSTEAELTYSYLRRVLGVEAAGGETSGLQGDAAGE